MSESMVESRGTKRETSLPKISIDLEAVKQSIHVEEEEEEEQERLSPTINVEVTSKRDLI